MAHSHPTFVRITTVNRTTTCIPNALATSLLAWVLMAWPAVACAHPFHISIAEVEWNQETRRFEVSLKVQPSDLERALTRLANKRVKLEDQDVDQWIDRYLQRHFFLVDASHCKAHGDIPIQSSVSRIHFVGKEVDIAWMWIYFEVELRKTPESMALVNTVLMDVNDGQINTVTIRSRPNKRAVKMTRETPCHLLRPDEGPHRSSTSAEASTTSQAH